MLVVYNLKGRVLTQAHSMKTNWHHVQNFCYKHTHIDLILGGSRALKILTAWINDTVSLFSCSMWMWNVLLFKEYWQLWTLSSSCWWVLHISDSPWLLNAFLVYYYNQNKHYKLQNDRCGNIPRSLIYCLFVDDLFIITFLQGHQR